MTGVTAGHLKIMGHKNDRDAMLAIEFSNGFQQTRGGSKVQTGSRFIHNHQQGIPYQGTRHHGALSLTTGNFPDAAISYPVNSHDFHGFVDPTFELRLCHRQSSCALPDKGLNGRRNGRVEITALGHKTDSCSPRKISP